MYRWARVRRSRFKGLDATVEAAEIKAGETALKAETKTASGFQDGVVAAHPVRQKEVDSSRLNETSAAARKLKGTALPQEVGVDATFDGDRRASSVVAAGRKYIAEVDEPVASRTAQPTGEQVASFRITAAIRALDGTIDQVEMGVAVIVGCPAKDPVGVEIALAMRTRKLGANQAEHSNRDQVELEIGRMRVGDLGNDRSADRERAEETLVTVGSRESIVVDLTTDLKQRQALIDTLPKHSRGLPAGHAYGPVVLEQEFEGFGNDRPDLTADL